MDEDKIIRYNRYSQKQLFAAQKKLESIYKERGYYGLMEAAEYLDKKLDKQLFDIIDNILENAFMERRNKFLNKLFDENVEW
jgi:hypothetical protein